MNDNKYLPLCYLIVNKSMNDLTEKEEMMLLCDEFDSKAGLLFY